MDINSKYNNYLNQNDNNILTQNIKGETHSFYTKLKNNNIYGGSHSFYTKLKKITDKKDILNKLSPNNSYFNDKIRNIYLSDTMSNKYTDVVILDENDQFNKFISNYSNNNGSFIKYKDINESNINIIRDILEDSKEIVLYLNFGYNNT